MASNSTSDMGFVRIEVQASSGLEGERVAAEAFEAGAAGLEERSGKGGFTSILLYAPASRGDAVRRAALRCVADPGAVGGALRVENTDWSEAWKAGLREVVVSPRLVIRPSFVSPGSSGVEAAELVIDPGQAFGTGSHASTRLALEWIDELAAGLSPGGTRAGLQGRRVLDVGTGTGVLALAALRLGAARVVAFDCDPLATAAARTNATVNALQGGLDLFTGELGALCETAFDLVVANLLRSELMPLLADIEARIAPGGHAIFAGLLAGEQGEVERALAEVGLRVAATRSVRESVSEGSAESSVEDWIGILTVREPSGGSSGRAGGRGSP